MWPAVAQEIDGNHDAKYREKGERGYTAVSGGGNGKYQKGNGKFDRDEKARGNNGELCGHSEFHHAYTRLADRDEFCHSGYGENDRDENTR
jgi:hypothetical protein